MPAICGSDLHHVFTGPIALNCLQSLDGLFMKASERLSSREVPFSYLNFFMKQLLAYAVVGAQTEEDLSSFHKALDWIAKGDIDVTKMVSHRLSLESISQALNLAHERDDDALKVTLTF